MEEAAPDIFKVDDENGMVALYKRVQQSHLAVGAGEVFIPAKLLGFAKAEQAAHLPSFKEMVAATATDAEKAA